MVMAKRLQRPHERGERTDPLRWNGLGSSFPRLTVEHAIDRAQRRERGARVMAEMPLDHASAHRVGAVWRQRLTELDDGRFDVLRGLGRGGLRTPGALLRPGGFCRPIAMLPFVQPTFCTAHLVADRLNAVSVQVALHRELAALFKGGRRDVICTVQMLTSQVAICSRCHGTIPLPCSYRGC